MISEGLADNASDAARKAGLTSTRVYQLLALLRLDPTIIAAIEASEPCAFAPSEKALYKLSQLPKDSQLERFAALQTPVL